MPRRLATPCAEPGCPALTQDRRCPEHEKQQQRRLNAQRPSPGAQGYGARWRRLRAAKLKTTPLCEVCGALATEVDHRKPKSQGGTDAWANLQSLCKPDHSRFTAKYDGRWGQRRDGKTSVD